MGRQLDGQGVAPAISLLRPGEPSPRTWAVPDHAKILELAWAPDGRTLAIATLRTECSSAMASRLLLLDPDAPEDGPPSNAASMIMMSVFRSDALM